MKKQLKKVKKSLIIAVLAGTLCLAFPLSVSAATDDSPAPISTETSSAVLVSETTEYLPDGCSITTQVYESPSLPNVGLFSPYAASYTKDGSKSITYNDDNGKALWSYTVNAKFTVNPGVSATCTGVVGNPKIYDSSWSVYSNTPSRSGSTGKGVIVMQKKSAGVVVKKVTKTVTVKCSANGVIS